MVRIAVFWGSGSSAVQGVLLGLRLAVGVQQRIALICGKLTFRVHGIDYLKPESLPTKSRH